MVESWEELVDSAEQASTKIQFDQAKQLLEQALVLANQFEVRDNRLIQNLHKLAEACHRTGCDDRAEELLLRAIAINTSNFGPYHKSVADSSNHLASIYYEQSRFAEAEKLCRQIVNSYEKSLGSKHLEVGKVSQNLAMILQEQNKMQEAEAFYAKALKIMRESAGPFDSDIISLLENYAHLLRSAGRIDEADHLQACALGRVSGSLRSVTSTRIPQIEI
ncbi:tetratricopeptide repeat protein [bacterium]|jgi:tetratricopeptide (TPR) repeat protein|nr:tetratricopeptide repeat protein [bacterium]